VIPLFYNHVNKTDPCDGPNKSLQDTFHRGKGSITCSRTKGLYFEDLKLEEEEEGDRGKR
jgi:hypothetical protein